MISSNQIRNTIATLSQFLVLRKVVWLGSIVALHWIFDESSYKQVIRKRVSKIMNKQGTEWRHVSSAKSLSDVGSWG